MAGDSQHRKRPLNRRASLPPTTTTQSGDVNTVNHITVVRREGGHNISSSQHRTFTQENCSSRRWRRIWCQRVVVFSLVVLFVWDLGVLHSRVLSSSPTPTTTDYTHEGNSSTFISIREDLLTKHGYDRLEQELQRAAQQAVQKRQRKRRERSTPRQSSSPAISSVSVVPLSSQKPIVVTQINDDPDWNLLCSAASLDGNSTRLLMVNVFAKGSIGPALGMILSHHCGVKNITLVDPLLPNTAEHRMKVLSNYFAPLFQQIPNHVQLQVPVLGMSSLDDLSVSWLEKLSPTHILLLPGPVDSSFFASTASRDLYQRQHTHLALEQLLQHATQTTTTTRFLQIVSTDHQEYSSEADALLRYYAAQRGTASIQQLCLPTVYGPAVVASKDDESPNQIYVTAAVEAVFKAFQSRGQLIRHVIQVNNTSQKRSGMREIATKSWTANHDIHAERAFPFSSEISRGTQHYDSLLGTHATNLPCLSTCNNKYETGNSSSCVHSAWDQVAHVTRSATKHCKNVMYIVNLSLELDTLPQPESRSRKLLCRIALVHEASPLVQSSVKEMLVNTDEHGGDVENVNGEVEVNHWKLVWLSSTDPLSDIDTALPIIDPGRLFASTVEKALYADREEFTTAPDTLIARIIQRIDRPAYRNHMIKEKRSGVPVVRSIPVPDAPTRRVVLFAGESPMQLNSTYFLNRLPSDQFKLYSMLEELAQSETLRPESTIDTTNAMFWTDLSIMAHDLTEGYWQTHLRCSWFQEYLRWGSNRGIEQLSLAFVLGQWRLQGMLGLTRDNNGYTPLLEEEGEEHQQRVAMNAHHEEMYVRILKRRGA